jgi:hypothetical protein
MKRREFIAGLGSAAAWPVVAPAQQTKILFVRYPFAEALTDVWREIFATFKIVHVSHVNRIVTARQPFHIGQARIGKAIAFAAACVALIIFVLTGAASSQELLVYKDRPNAAAKVRFGKAPMSPTIHASQGISANSAGYLEILNASPIQFNVEGAWEVPNIFNPYPNIPSDQEVDIWVGIGGQTKSDNTLIQIGTSAEIDASGNQIYGAWYQLDPTGPTVVLDAGMYPVRANDAIKVGLSCSPGPSSAGACMPNQQQYWHLYIINSGPHTYWTWSITLTYQSSLLTAEWYVEAPTLRSDGSIVPLPGFSDILFQTSESLIKPIYSNSPLIPVKMNDPNGGNAIPCPFDEYNFTVYNRTSCSPPSVTHDFNNDGRSDIAWLDGSGNLAFRLMNGAGAIASGGVGGIPSSWSIVGQRDFDGNGTYDLLWRDNLGNAAIWFMNGTQVSSSAGIGNIPVAWSVMGTGDFNSDGFGDILWRDSSGNVAVWLMNGAAVLSSAGLGNVPATWNVVGTGDFNGDGKTDLLWRDNAGNTSIWFMNGTTVASTAGVGNIPTSWSVVGTGDFNRDGMSDIVWRDNGGNTSIWLMNGAAVSSSGGLGNVPTNWSIALVGDFNGDGMSDLLWRDNFGNTSMWFMNGTMVASTAGVGNIPTNWTVQSVNAE